MDGVTDAAFRTMVCRHSRPSLTITEFTNVEGLARGGIKMLTAFYKTEIDRPSVAQIYGVEEASYYKAALLVAFLGFDGVDINMGCPATKVSKKGSGAGLIRTPKLAQQLVRATQKGCEDWANGITLEEAGLHPDIIAEANAMQPTPVERTLLPVSVKTRIGYDDVVTEDWIKTLLETEPANISLHGRTLKQLYTGQANWEEIGKAAQLTKNTATTLLGNGDIKTMDDAREKIKTYGIDGVLVGRATFGNPWFFSDKTPTPEECLHAAIEHSEILENDFPQIHFQHMRKHLIWYCHHFPGARELRSNLMKTQNTTEVRSEIMNYLETLNDGAAAPAPQ